MTFKLAAPAAPARTPGSRGRRLGRRTTALVAAAGLALSACSGAEQALVENDVDSSKQSGSGSEGGGTLGSETVESTGDNPFEGLVEDPVEADLPFGDEYETGEEAIPEPVEVDELRDVSAPDEIIADVEAELPEDGSTESVLDAIEPIDRDIDLTTDRQGRTTNEAGELVGLDDQASLACANIEIALTALDEGQDSTATDQVRTASARASESAMASINEWSEPLAASITGEAVADVAPLIGFISVCAEGGYEL